MPTLTFAVKVVFPAFLPFNVTPVFFFAERETIFFPFFGNDQVVFLIFFAFTFFTVTFFFAPTVTLTLFALSFGFAAASAFGAETAGTNKDKAIAETITRFKLLFMLFPPF